MKSNTYLYGEEAEVPEIPEYIIMRRIELLNDNLELLLSVDYMIRDSARIIAIVEALKFWENINES